MFDAKPVATPLSTSLSLKAADGAAATNATLYQSAFWYFIESHCHLSEHIFCCQQVILVHAPSISYSLAGY